MQVEPFAQVRRRLAGSYFGLSHGGEVARIPLSPSTMMSRTSAAVLPISTPRPYRSLHQRANSLSVRVLPKPRPASSNQMDQSAPVGMR